MEKQILIATEPFACSSNELRDSVSGELVLVIYNNEDVDLPEGLWLSTEGYYEAVISNQKIMPSDVEACLTELSDITGVSYELALN
ncbi:MAG: hypothetical protein M9940_02235 [Bacteroidetes bacterium]|nr:MAG: hypothetical protein UZ10_BCD003001118 [Bacteroidetes bacterium OLB10]MCE7954349.1 hypothetical protein [Bacteroidetes bacterium CHB6]MCO5288220.1 hypothetical protein [Bacteroidota bacterium]